MNAGSPVESMYVPWAAIAARTAGSPHFANGPTVLTSTSPRSSSANTELRRSASAVRHSMPRRSASSRTGLLRPPREHRRRSLRGEPLGHQAAR